MVAPAARNRRQHVKLPGPLSGRHDGLVLTLLRDRGPLSRSEIAETSGLSPTTVTKAVAPLVTAGYVEEGAAPGGARIGRPAVALHLRSEMLAVCGIQIGVGTAQAAVVDGLGRVVAQTAFTFDDGLPQEEALRSIARRVDVDLLEEHDPVAVGVAAPGVVEADGRTNSLSLNLGWSDAPLADIFEPELGLPVIAEHNVSAMALAESRFGARASSLAFVYVKTGVGLGLVLRGEPFLGGRHGVSELGHIHVSDTGEPCTCGSTGCLEAVAAEPALTRALAAIPGSDGDNPLQRMEEHAPQDPAVDELLQRTVDDLSTGLAAVVNLLGPELVVVGGILDGASDELLERLDLATRARVFPLLRETLRLVRPTFGSASGVVGAAAVALERFVYSVRG